MSTILDTSGDTTGLGPAFNPAAEPIAGQVNLIAQLAALDDASMYPGQRYYVGNSDADVPSVHSTYHLEETTALTPDGITVINAASGTRQWVRDLIGNKYWQSRTVWYIDPAGTNPTLGGLPGNDENSGLTATAPIRTMAEFCRRNWDGRIAATLYVLTSSNNSDDRYIYGFSTLPGTTGLQIVGVPTVLFSGTVTGYVSPISNGNNRGQIVDSALPVSWTASDGICSPSGSRFIRKTDKTIHAAVIKDLGSKTCQIGPPNHASESAGVFGATVGNFTVGDAYEVCTQLRWPTVTFQAPELFVSARCLDFYAAGGNSNGSLLTLLCGHLAGFSGKLALYGCYVTGTCTSSAGVSASSNAFVGPGVLQPNGNATWHGQLNTFLGNFPLHIWHNGQLDSTGVLQVFDFTDSLGFLSVRYASMANIVPDSMIGDNNTGVLVNVQYGSTVTGAAAISAVTSNPNPYLISGTASPTPYWDTSTGSGVYN